ncbi:MAG: bifunctional salicylyl-CoA 5-hydroxylase/oxidoreductase [Betaproteobacteria bacterium]|nr:bifunctional salicylyl-CoA 5-hydroxylase/oxidoreductase [Candidatus Fonsibacter lacus]
MKIVCVGGGPAGLYFGLLMKKRHPGHEVVVVERNRPYDTFGWGVFNHWDDIAVHINGATHVSGGHGFCGIGRKRLLNILQRRCEEVGVELVFETEIPADEDIAARHGADLVIACDGVNSRIRERFAATYQPDIDVRHCRFVWLGTRKLFKAFTFAFEQTEHGWFQAHAYQFDGDTSTFIVECPEEVWQAAGLEHMTQEQSIAYCEGIFAKYLDNKPLMSNATHLRGSAMWIKFQRVICQHWTHWVEQANGRRVPYVLMGDAAHTAHFSIGSGTKLALEDAIAMADAFDTWGHQATQLPEVLKRYEDERALEVLKIQNAARNSTEWFERVERYVHMDPAQLTYAEMTCVSAEGRITPGCPGLWNEEQMLAWQRITDFVHQQSDAKIALQLGHAGRKGSTRRAWDGIDQPLDTSASGEANWPLLAPSAVPYIDGVSQVPAVMTEADMDAVCADFEHATRLGVQAGFDWLELHCAHGYLLSGFISPLTNRRTDAYGGTLENRLRFPLRVFAAMRAIWPQDKPMSVRISAHDWVEGGITPDDAVQIARAFKQAGVDFVDCSSGQVDRREKPVYGRMFQTPFADRIRNEAGVKTIAVGAISEADHVNSIIAAGRADLCAVARPHLANPAWTLTEAARIGYQAQAWPKPYASAKRQLETQFERAVAPAAVASPLSVTKAPS